VRVLHLNAGNLFGGIETYLLTLARCRDLAPNMESHFGLCFPGRLRDDLLSIGVAVYDLGPVRLSRPWTVLAARRRLMRLNRRARFDAVVTHGCWPHAVFAPAARRTGARLVNAVHGDLSRPGRIDRRAARTPPDLVIANSYFTAGPAQILFAPAPVEVVYLPVPAPDLGDRRSIRQPARDELGTPSVAVVILQASRLERWKGHAVLLEALARLKDVPGWEAWIVGGPQKAGEAELLDELLAIAKRRAFACRVRFLGQRSDVPRLMAAADIYCQPNTEAEPFGLAIVEALYAGLPVVASALGGPCEIVDPTCGILAPPNDPTAVAAALKELILNPTRCRELGAAGPMRAASLCDPARALTDLAAAIARRPAPTRGPAELALQGEL
jgi:glycosyltransferase involved in cell wall biosynthesis